MGDILALGLNMVDKYPQLGNMYPGGNELNVAVFARRLGYHSAYMGNWGNDAEAEMMQRLLREEGVDTSHCRGQAGPSGYAIVELRDGDRVFTGGNNGGVAGLYPFRVAPRDHPYIRGFRVVVSSVYGRVPLEELAGVAALGVPLAYDFSNQVTPEQEQRLLAHLSYGFVSAAAMDDDETEQLLRKMHRLGCGYCVATLGERGALYFDGASLLHQPATPVEVVDTMGAGDSFIACMLCRHRDALDQGDTQAGAAAFALEQAARFAAETCQINGAIGHPFPMAGT